MQPSKNQIILVCFFLWLVIISLIIFQTFVFNHRFESDNMAFSMIISILGAGMGFFLFWGVSILIAKIITRFTQIELKGSIAFLTVSLFFAFISLFTMLLQLRRIDP